MGRERGSSLIEQPSIGSASSARDNSIVHCAKSFIHSKTFVNELFREPETCRNGRKLEMDEKLSSVTQHESFCRCRDQSLCVIFEVSWFRIINSLWLNWFGAWKSSKSVKFDLFLNCWLPPKSDSNLLYLTKDVKNNKNLFYWCWFNQ